MLYDGPIKEGLELSGDEYRKLVEQSSEVIFAVNTNGLLTYISPAIERYAGYTSREVLGQAFSVFVHPDDLPGLVSSFHATLEGITEPWKFRILLKDGSIRHVQTSSRPIQENGQAKGLVGVLTDITVHVRAEQVQHAIYQISEAVLTTQNLDELFALIHRIVGELMPARNFYIALNDAQSDTIHFPYFRDEFDTNLGPMGPGKSLTGYVLRTKESLLATRETCAALERAGEVELIGAPSVDWLGVPLRTPRGETIGVMTIQTYTESTRLTESDKNMLVFVSAQVAMAIERKRAEEQLTREHGLLTTLIRHLPDAVYVKDLESRFLYANAVVARIMRADRPEQLVGKTDFDFYPADVAARFRAEEVELMQTGERFVDRDETRVDRNGETLYIVNTKVPFHDATGKIVGLVGVGRDLTARERAEQALRASQARLQSIFRASPTGIILAEAGVLVEVNERFCELTGYSREELLGQLLQRLYADQNLYGLVQEDLESQTSKKGWGSVESQWLRKDGTIIDVLLNSALLDPSTAPTSQTITVVDISEQKKSEREHARLEEQLGQLQKMDSIGRLAGGVAHDFNNLLTAISGNLHLALMDLERDESPTPRLHQAIKATETAAMLTQQLLAFSRKQIIEPKVIDLSEVLANMREMLARLTGEDVGLVIVSGRPLGRVRVDPGQIEQITINLCANARDAMPAGGRITIETTDVVLDEAYCRRHGGMSPGHYVRLSVSDTGIGMTKETLSHIFEPFFTTKAKGKGTGLGLSMVYGAVKQNGGSVEVYSEPGRGSVFKIYLPRVEARPERTSPFQIKNLPGGNETVLLVEDEAFIRAFAEDILRQLGYDVISAANIRDAVDQANGLEGTIHLLLTDVVLPDGNARALVEILSKTRPDIKVLFTSGYAENVISHHGVLDAGVQFIGKPFTVAGLAAKIREILNAGEPPQKARI